MAESIIPNRIITFSSFQSLPKQSQSHHSEAYNSLILQLSQLDKYKEVDSFTICQQEDCQMILTDQDKDNIQDWSSVSMNLPLYSHLNEKLKAIKEDPEGLCFWTCRFCEMVNLVKKELLFFAGNRSKCVMKSGEEKGKVCESPLILFVIDNSSSMDEQIPEPHPNNQKHFSYFLNEKIKKTGTYKNLVESEKSSLAELKKQLDPTGQTKYDEHLSKYKILMGMTESILNSICSSMKYNIKMSVKRELDRKIGFIFVNSDVFLLKGGPANVFKVRDRGENKSIQAGLEVDFFNFEELFQTGVKFGQDYGVDMASFKFSDLKMNSILPKGQSALGPALVIGSGIISRYGSGSLIVVITDGKANNGIFSKPTKQNHQLSLLSYKLQKSRSQACLIKLQTSLPQPPEPQPVQQFFIKKQKTIKINLTTPNPLQTLQSLLKKTIQSSLLSKTWTNNIRIKCQNQNMKYPQKQLQRMKKKLFKQSQISFIAPKINQMMLRDFDYQHTFMTQVIVDYQDIATKRESRFFGFLLQKLVKVADLVAEDLKIMNSVETLGRVIGYLDAEGERLNVQNIPLTTSQNAFRSFVRQSYNQSFQQGLEKEAMEQFNLKPVFKNPKDYIKSLIKKDKQSDPDKEKKKEKFGQLQKEKEKQKKIEGNGHESDEYQTL